MEEKNENGVKRDKLGQYTDGSIGGPGRKKETEEDKIKKKANKEFIKEYIDKLSEALPTISPVLIKKAEEGDMTAIKELNDRVMGKAPQRTDITSDGKPIIMPNVILDKNKIKGDEQEL